ncbi:MAG TPA: AroM family protein [Candidatus Dormibacteraeota bacterium]|nr:AroM family protein [Candidatus Dormibacteraeota bacterium]
MGRRWPEAGPAGSARRLGILTIGQAPRPDGLAREVAAVLGEGFAVVERGALDDLEPGDLARLAPRPGRDLLVTRLRDGSSVRVAEEAIVERLQRQIGRLEDEDGVEATLLLCTGAFPPFRHRRPLLQPQAALHGAALGIAGPDRLGALIPLPEQRPQMARVWRERGADVVLVAADPYGPEPEAAVEGAAAAAWDRGARVLLMDCFGYDLSMRRAAARAFAGPVLLARSLAARLLLELAA